MIFPTTVVLTLFLAQIARAAPQTCGDHISPESLTPNEQHSLLGLARTRISIIPLEPGPVILTYKAVYNPIYDRGDTSVRKVSCSNYAERFPEFKNLPLFPNIGGAFNTTFGSDNCGVIWKLTNVANSDSIYFTAIDDANVSFDISLDAFEKLGGRSKIGHVYVEAERVAHVHA